MCSAFNHVQISDQIITVNAAASSTDSPPCCCVVATSCVRKSSSWISPSEPTCRSTSPDQRQEAEQWRRIYQGRVLCLSRTSGTSLRVSSLCSSLGASRGFMDAQLTFTADWRWLFLPALVSLVSLFIFMDVLLITFKPFQSLWDISGSSTSIISETDYRCSFPVCTQLFVLFMLTCRRLSPPFI